MTFSARQGARKWRRLGKMVTVATLLGLACASPPGQARRGASTSRAGTMIPLPRPRPSEAPAREDTEEAEREPQNAPAAEPSAKSGEPAAAHGAAPQAAPLSACRQALTPEIAVAPSIPAVHGPGGCGGDDLVRLEAVVLPDQRRVAVTPPAILRCPMATAVAAWVRSDVAPLTQKLGSEIAALDNFDSFECRSRNRLKGAPLSEHGKANALDVRAFKLADGREIALTDRSQPRLLREDVLHSACTRFTTVLGPDSDWFHEDHIHLDVAERRNNYRICQWDVLDPMPQVAPLMPQQRPEDAPPRQVAKGDSAKEEDSREAGPAPDTDESEVSKPAAKHEVEQDQGKIVQDQGKPGRARKPQK